ncbi:MAG TPA: hypothetical protein PLT55_00035 [Acidimicrobiia bacterium]|nr:hypothetical protein [Acidimicrobiia bacterium]
MNIFPILIGGALGIGFYLLFANILRKFWISAPSEPNPDDLSDVDISFRCGVCGSQVTMTMAPTGEIPDAPRHCREDMIITTAN